MIRDYLQDARAERFKGLRTTVFFTNLGEI
jgi:hypothetical protein